VNNLNIPDAYRSQYYLKNLSKEVTELKQEASDIGLTFVDENLVFDEIFSDLAANLDKLLLPVVAYEMAVARNSDLLAGQTPEERYKSFFVSEGSWTPLAKSMASRYQYMQYILEKQLKTSIQALRVALFALARDFKEVRETFLKKDEVAISSIIVSADADRHRGGRKVIIFGFEGDSKVVYKPVSLETYRLYEQFVKWLDLNSDYALFLPRLCPKKGYGWMEFVHNSPCDNVEEVEAFYRRSGVIVAIAEALNFTDGHLDNLIAQGQHPVLIDLETILQNYSMIDSPYNPTILTTMLVQKPPDEKSNRGIVAALMAPPTQRFDVLSPYPINERMDTLEVRFKGWHGNQSHNLPFIGNEFFSPHDFVDKVISGYTHTYELISEKLKRDYTENAWWVTTRKCRPRCLVRSTGAYIYLMLLAQQPEALMQRSGALSIIKAELSSVGEYWDVEIEDLLELDIPFFEYDPTERHLYDWRGECYKNIYPMNAIDYLEKSFKKRSRYHMGTGVSMLRQNLPASPSGRKIDSFILD
jgi:lantibiotic modifying enzyme